MRKVISFVLSMAVVFIMAGCSTAEKTEEALWRGIDVSYWQENDMADGAFTVLLGNGEKYKSQKGLANDFTAALLQTECTDSRQEDMFSFLLENKWYSAQLVRPQSEGDSYHIFFTDDFSQAVIYNTSAQPVEYDGGNCGTITDMPLPYVYTLTGGENVKNIFEQYDMLVE